MREDIIIAGFGGQGVLMAGKLLCLAGMDEKKNVSHIPSYGAEMRGGTANCSVIVSDEEIASPVVDKPSVCLVMNEPSLAKFEEKLTPGGLLILNSSLISAKPRRDDIEIVMVPANDLSTENGSNRGANMSMLGALAALKPALIALDSVMKALDSAVSERNRKFNDINRKILDAGNQFLRKLNIRK